MRHLLQDIKTILEYERSVFGAYVPIFDVGGAGLPAPDSPTAEPSSDAATAGPSPDAAAAEPRPEIAAAGPRPDAASAKPSPDIAADGPSLDAATTEMPKSDAAPTEAPTSAQETIAMSSSDLFSPSAPAPRNHSRSPYERVHALIPDDSPLRSMQTLAEAEDYVRSTVLIPLDETRRNAVFGVGSPAADIMVIGEAPGADEDAQGEPFVGRAGQLLTKILNAIGFEREEVYIANILKSRPPNNRDPLPAEVEAHVPILYKQIALIQPKLILCVGRTSGTTLLNKRTSLGALRQKFHDWHGLPVLVTYHPAALLRNPNWKRPTWEDVQLLRKRYDELVDAAEVA